MTNDEVRHVAAAGESAQVEFKKSTGDLVGGLESLCAFLNGKGGSVLFGVTDAGKVVGQQVTDATLRDVAAALAKVEPTAEIEQVRIPVGDGREVLVLETGLRAEAPYTYRARAYQRVGTTTRPMPQAEYQRRLLERDHARQRWENQPTHGFGLDDLDAKEIRQAVIESTAAGRHAEPWSGVADTLRRFRMLTSLGLTQAAAVAFSNDPVAAYPQCALRLARFRGVTKDDFLDQNQLTGHAFLLLREAMLFLRRHLPVSGRFEPGVLERIDEPLFPILALREAVVNALIHRDYSIYGGANYVAIFDDRVEIISAGTLPFGLTPVDLMRDHDSRPRNPDLADVFYRRGYIERWGRGTQKIVEMCVAAGHPTPQFEERAGSVVVRFLVKGYVPPMRIGHDLTERQRRILYILRDGVRQQSKEIRSQLVPIPSVTVLRDELNLLRRLKLIDGSGHGAGARWWLIGPDRPNRAE